MKITYVILIVGMFMGTALLPAAGSAYQVHPLSPASRGTLVKSPSSRNPAWSSSQGSLSPSPRPAVTIIALPTTNKFAESPEKKDEEKKFAVQEHSKKNRKLKKLLKDAQAKKARDAAAAKKAQERETAAQSSCGGCVIS